MELMHDATATVAAAAISNFEIPRLAKLASSTMKRELKLYKRMRGAKTVSPGMPVPACAAEPAT
jgi:hypothetical protein